MITQLFFGVAIGAIVGSFKKYAANAENLKSDEIRLKADVEKNWMRLKLPKLEEDLKQAETAVAGFSIEDLNSDKQNVKDDLRNRDQLLLLKSYFEAAVGRR